MADQSLQAFQLGASLFDRAQTQQRLMEQFQLQAAESVLQQQGMALQNQIRDIALADAIGEQKAQVEEFKAFSDLGKQVGDYLDNPTSDSKFPVIPAFKSKQYRLEADRMLNNLEKYSARAKLMKAKDAADAKASELTRWQFQTAADYGAFKIDPATGKVELDYNKINEIAAQRGQANLEKTKAQTSSITAGIDAAKARINELIRSNASKEELSRASLDYKKLIDKQRLELDQQELDLKKLTGEEERRIKERGLEQAQQRIDLLRQKILQPTKSANIKLDPVDDRFVKKYADDIANKQTIADAIGYEIGVIQDPSIEDYVKLQSANNIAKVLNSAEGKDAVGVEESKRLLGELDIFSVRRAFQGGSLIGPDLESFSNKLALKQGELETRVKESSNRINDIYSRYGLNMPAGTTRGQTAPVGPKAPAVPMVQPSVSLEPKTVAAPQTNSFSGLTPKAKRVRQGGKEYVWDETINNWKEVSR